MYNSLAIVKKHLINIRPINYASVFPIYLELNCTNIINNYFHKEIGY